MARPGQGQADPLRQSLGREVNGLGSGEDACHDIGRQECKWEQVADVAIGDAFGLGDLDERSGAAARELLALFERIVCES